MRNENNLSVTNPCSTFTTVSKVIGVTLFIIMSSCSGTRFLKEGETFYGGAEVRLTTEGKISEKKEVKKQLHELIGPKPNSSFLGSRPSVWFYYIAGTPKKKKGFRNFVKNKMGKEPLLITDVEPFRTASMLERQVNNEGYFGSEVTSEVKTKRKESKVIYTVTLMKPFTLRNISFNLFDTLRYDQKKMEKETLLKKEQRYSLERLKAEQQRVEDMAKNNGFYYFDERYLLFEADTTVGKRQVDLKLIFENGTPSKAKRIYTLSSINVFPNYSLGNDSIATTSDTVRVNNLGYIDNQHIFRPEIVASAINLETDSIYRRIDHEYTLSRLMSLRSFKFVNIKYRESDSDSSGLHAEINLTPLLKKSLRLQAEAVSKSNNFVGPGLDLTFTNRNLFRGAELLQLKLNGSYEWQISRQQTGSLNSIEFGLESSLVVPRFIAPFHIPYRSSKYMPQTIIKGGFNFQQRIDFFRLTSFNVAYGYNWRETTFKTHEFFPVELSFVRSSKTSPEFDELLAQNPSLSNSFQNQFIPGLKYSFTLNTQLKEDIEEKYRLKGPNKSNIYFNGKIDLAGNILNSIQSGIRKNESEPYELFGQPYSQFARGEVDFRYYLQLDKRNKIASRINIGVGYAYGNSTYLPYTKQFSVGGSNSVRAFPARSIGPGTYNVRTDTSFTSNTYFIDQRGDVKLELNLEYRFDILKALKGALFTDAGNIWLLKEDEARPGGYFNKDTFLSELAVGVGAGLRYDFNFFLLRFDVAFPIRKPYRAPEDRWVINEINFGSKDWRGDNLIFNIAFGYPF